MKIKNKQESIDKKFEQFLNEDLNEEERKEMLDMLPLLVEVAVEFYDLAQSNLLESASDGFKEYVAQNNGLYFGDDHRKEMDLRVWQACSLYHSRLIKEKDKIIENKSEYIFMLRKEIKEKDERIEELENDCIKTGEKLRISNESIKSLNELLDEAVKDIESLDSCLTQFIDACDWLAFRSCQKNTTKVMNNIRSKYGLDKQESNK